VVWLRSERTWALLRAATASPLLLLIGLLVRWPHTVLRAAGGPTRPSFRSDGTRRIHGQAGSLYDTPSAV